MAEAMEAGPGHDGGARGGSAARKKPKVYAAAAASGVSGGGGDRRGGQGRQRSSIRSRQGTSVTGGGGDGVGDGAVTSSIGADPSGCSHPQRLTGCSGKAGEVRAGGASPPEAVGGRRRRLKAGQRRSPQCCMHQPESNSSRVQVVWRRAAMAACGRGGTCRWGAVPEEDPRAQGALG